MVGLAIRNEAGEVARQLFGGRDRSCADFTRCLLDFYEQAEGKDFLVIHNPGGWGSSRLDRCLEWEKSIVEGVGSAIARLGYSAALTQYFRTRDTQWAHFLDVMEQVRIFFKGRYSQARVLAAQLAFIMRHVDRVRIIMVGVSQGAGFSNAVMRQLGDGHRVYSIELGTMFIQVPRRLCTDHTLVIDNNGIEPDPFVRRDLWAGTRAYAVAPLRWMKYRMLGKPQRFTHCVVMRGHDYSWEYTGVRQQIETFLGARFGNNLEEHRQ
jgi:pimeloyl-ACP methyl ester carboxylesterase